MKGKSLLLLVMGLFLGAMALSPVSAQATTYFGSDFATMGYYDGAYVSTPPGYAALSYASAQSPSLDDAVVGVKGPLGLLSNLNMSFTYSNLVGTSV
jgi:hypothetical protein